MFQLRAATLTESHRELFRSLRLLAVPAPCGRNSWRSTAGIGAPYRTSSAIASVSDFSRVATS
jgi:hypothetical protein